MPLPWPHIPATVFAMQASADPQAASVAQQVHHSGGTFTAFGGPYPHYVLDHGTVTYGDSKITADHIEYHPKGALPVLHEPGMSPGTLISEGNVVLTDPLGTLHAARLRFSTLTHSGFADDIELEVEGLTIKADHVEIVPGKWTLTGTEVHETSGPVHFKLQTNRTVIRLGDKIILTRVKLSIFGEKFSHSGATLGLKRGFGSGEYPTPAYDSVNGFGAHWQPAYRLANNLAINGALGVSERTVPGYSFHLTHTFTSVGENEGLVVAGTDVDRRFGGSYFDTISVTSPQNERQLLAIPQSSLSLGSNYNYQVFDRLGNELFARPFEATLQQSFKLPGGSVGEVHTAYQNLRLTGSANQTRWYGQGLVDPPLIHLTSDLDFVLRFEGLTYQGANENYSWLRSESGFTYRPSPNLRLGASAVLAQDFGTPLFQADRLYSKNGLLLRGDYRLGPRRLSTLFALDARSGRWYDSEFMVSQDVGPFRGFAIWRTFPGEFIFGVELRPDSLFNMLSSRSGPSSSRPPADRLK
jgi:hypothetical protein